MKKYKQHFRLPHLFKGSPHTTKPTLKRLRESGTKTWELTTTDGTTVTAYNFKSGYIAMRALGRWTVIEADLDLVNKLDKNDRRLWRAINYLHENLENNAHDREMQHRVTCWSNEPGGYDSYEKLLTFEPHKYCNDVLDLRDDITTTIKLMGTETPMCCFLAHRYFGYTYREIAERIGKSHTTARTLSKNAESLLMSVHRAHVRV